MKNIKGLMELGLTGRESRVYMACLKLGNGSVSEVAAMAKYAKSSTHELLKSLVKKGLVHTYVKKNRNYFTAANPQILKEKLDKQERVADRIMPDLLTAYNSSHDQVKVSFYEGDEGLRSVLNMILREAKELESVAYADEVINLMKEHFGDFMNKRVEKGIPIKLIFRNSKIAHDRKKIEKQLISQMKIVDTPIPFESTMVMWNNKVAIFAFRDNFTITVLEGGLEYKLMKSMFNLLWNNVPDVS